jgi:hypothetical protein
MPARAIGYPTNRLIAVIDDPAAAAGALAELRASGVPVSDLEILRGPEGADRLDGMGHVRGGLARVRRWVDFTLMDQLPDFAHYEYALRDGRAVLMVRARDEGRKAAALAILRRHGGHFINYYGRFATEDIDLWHGVEPDIPNLLRR